MTDDFKPIRPKAVALTHVEAKTAARGGSRSHWIGTAALAGAAALLLVVFLWVPRLIESPAPPGPVATDTQVATPAAPADPVASAAPDAAAPGPAPFEHLQREQARAAAQTALSRFVELQLQLEAKMQVGAWGSDAFGRAKDRAAAGDEAFLREEFDTAIQGYQAAAADLEALIAEGTRILEQAIADGTAALDARNPTDASAAYQLASTIAPEDPRVTAGAARAARLPEVNELLRTARNQELASNWNAALETLRAVERLDPDTSGLADALARVNAAAGRSRLQAVVSAGFAHLDAARYEAARAAFADALRLDPGNASAQGGLEQVDRQLELTRLERLRLQAERALADERWADAEATYAEALALDPNIQFALAGRSQARARQQAGAALAAIISDPDRLSSERVYAEARTALTAAEALDSRGPALNAQIDQVRAILATYAQPVPVVLRSDNQTQITVSSVGPLGAFSEKQLVLRPGAYTVVGSRDGCRDVREQILVRPDMGPVDIRCTETL